MLADSNFTAAATAYRELMALNCRIRARRLAGRRLHDAGHAAAISQASSVRPAESNAVPPARACEAATAKAMRCR